MTYAIAKDIPAPLPARAKGYTEAMRKLEPGWSVFFPEANINSICKCAREAIGRHCYRARTVPGGVRVWRTR